MANRRRGNRLIAAVLLAGPAALYAHPHSGTQFLPHEHTPLGLEITIADDGVTCAVLLSNGYFNVLIPCERGRLKLARRGEVYAFLEPAQEEAERDAFGAFFADGIARVTIDGAEVPAEFSRLEFLPSVDPTGVLDHSLAPPDARVFLRCATSAPPQSVKIEWMLFPIGRTRDLFGNVRPPELPVKLDAYAESRIVTITPEQPELSWKKPPPDVSARIATVQVQQVERPKLHVPLLSAGLIGAWLVLLIGLRLGKAPRSLRRGALLLGVVPLAGAYFTRQLVLQPVGRVQAAAPAPLSEKDAQQAFTALLSNVYRAFDYKNESDVYDVLALSVDGAQLEAIYNEVYQSLLARDQGGAVSRVKGVDFITVDVERAAAPAPSDGSYQVRCRWRVHGVVHHWGHVHERTNEYRARYTVAPRGDLWKITACELLGQRRLGSEAATAANAEAEQP